MRHFLECYDNVTFTATIYDLRMKYNNLKLKKSRVSASMVVEACSGNEKYGSSSKKQTAQNAMRLLQNVIDTIVKISHQEKLELHLHSRRLNGINLEQLSKY